MSAKRLAAVIVSVSLGLTLVQPASAKGPSKVLGRDPRGDAPSGLDLTWLAVGHFGDDLGVMIGIEDMTAAVALHNGAHAMWAFDVDDRTFLVEARVEAVQPRFDLYEITPRHYRELGTGFKGRYDSINGFVGILLPLELIGARSGSRVSGATSYREEDANTHVHLGTTTIAVDVLDTTKTFTIP